MRIGVLALQGAFIEHIDLLKSINVEAFEIRQLKDLDKPFDGLILPGGESTTMGKLLKDLGLFNPIKKLIEHEMPVLGTCAGLILLSKNILNDSLVHFGVMDICVKRNAYGRQLGSFKTTGYIEGLGNFPLVFIRAPYIESVGEDVTILANVDGHIVAALEKNMLATSFHPELANDNSFHKMFINMCKKKSSGN